MRAQHDRFSFVLPPAEKTTQNGRNIDDHMSCRFAMPPPRTLPLVKVTAPRIVKIRVASGPRGTAKTLGASRPPPKPGTAAEAILEARTSINLPSLKHKPVSACRLAQATTALEPTTTSTTAHHSPPQKPRVLGAWSLRPLATPRQGQHRALFLAHRY